MGISLQQLSTVELAVLIVMAQAAESEDSPAMNEIIRRFDGNARQIAATVCTRPATRDDVANAARLALVRAVRRHRPDRQGFVTYATTFMTGAARRESMRLAYPEQICLDGSDLATVIDSSSNNLRLAGESPPGQYGWGTGRVARMVAALPEPQQQLLAVRYVRDLDLARIAQLHGVSVSAVSQRLATVLKHVAQIIQSEPKSLHAVAA